MPAQSRYAEAASGQRRVDDQHAVPTAVLTAVHRLVGAPEHVAGPEPRDLHQGDADADRGAPAVGSGHDLVLADAREDPPRDRTGRRLARLREQDAELVASE